jgi:hypothetical protein
MAPHAFEGMNGLVIGRSALELDKADNAVGGQGLLHATEAAPEVTEQREHDDDQQENDDQTHRVLLSLGI